MTKHRIDAIVIGERIRRDMGDITELLGEDVEKRERGGARFEQG